MKAPALVVVLALVAAACGSGGSSVATTTTTGLTEFESFAREFSVTCRRPADLVAELGPPAGPVGLASNARQVVGEGESTVAELRQLRAPARQGEVDDLLDALIAVIDGFALLADAGADESEDAVDRAVTAIADAQAEARSLSDELGVDCGFVDPAATDAGAGSALDAVPPADPAATIDGFGANSQFDDLAGACFDGALDDCDSLFRSSPSGSAYERYAATCAERYAARLDGNCAAVGGDPRPPADTIDGFGDNATLDDLAEACFGGDLVACNELFFAAPEGSGYESYGATCGVRTERQVVGFCPQIQVS